MWWPSVAPEQRPATSSGPGFHRWDGSKGLSGGPPSDATGRRALWSSYSLSSTEATSCLNLRCTKQQPQHRPQRKGRYTAIPPSAVRPPVGERSPSCEATTTSMHRDARRMVIRGSPTEEPADRSRVGQCWAMYSSDGNPFTVQLSATPTAATCSLCRPAISLTVCADAHAWYV